MYIVSEELSGDIW